MMRLPCSKQRRFKGSLGVLNLATIQSEFALQMSQRPYFGLLIVFVCKAQPKFQKLLALCKVTHKCRVFGNKMAGGNGVAKRIYFKELVKSVFNRNDVTF